MPEATYQLHPLSSSTNFLPVAVSSILSSTAVSIHQAHATNYDEVWLRAFNYTGQDAILFLCIGGTGATQIMPVPIPAGVGEVNVLSGDVFTGGVVISAYASRAGAISVLGRVNRIVFV